MLAHQRNHGRLANGIKLLYGVKGGAVFPRHFYDAGDIFFVESCRDFNSVFVSFWHNYHLVTIIPKGISSV